MIKALIGIHLAGMAWSAIRSWPSRAFRVRQRSVRRDVAEEMLNACMWPIELGLDLLIAWDGAVHRVRTIVRKGRRNGR